MGSYPIDNPDPSIYDVPTKEDVTEEDRREFSIYPINVTPRTDCTDCGGFGKDTCTWPLCPTGEQEIPR